MNESFEGVWADMLAACPFSIQADTANWAKWMQDEGYKRRQHGGILHTRIVAEIFKIAEG